MTNAKLSITLFNIDKSGTSSIVGVGTPLAYLVATKEYQVIGIDNDLKKINAIREEKMLPTQLTDIYKDYKKNLLLTNDYNELKNADIVIICVPTPTIDDVPDLIISYNF